MPQWARQNRRQWKLAYLRLPAASVKERPESCVLTPERGRFANIRNRNYHCAYAKVSLYHARQVDSRRLASNSKDNRHNIWSKPTGLESRRCFDSAFPLAVCL